MNPTEAPPESAESEPKKEPRQRPVRRKVLILETEAAKFLTAAFDKLSREYTPLKPEHMVHVKPLLRNYCANTGIKGKQRELLTRIVDRQLSQIRHFKKAEVA